MSQTWRGAYDNGFQARRKLSRSTKQAYYSAAIPTALAFVKHEHDGFPPAWQALGGKCGMPKSRVSCARPGETHGSAKQPSQAARPAAVSANPDPQKTPYSFNVPIQQVSSMAAGNNFKSSHLLLPLARPAVQSVLHIEEYRATPHPTLSILCSSSSSASLSR